MVIDYLWHGMFSLFGLFWFTLWIAFMAVLAWFGLRLFKEFTPEDPVEIARRRYAEGEITKDELNA